MARRAGPSDSPRAAAFTPFRTGGSPRRNVYVCVVGTLHVRNHLAVRDILRARPDLRDRYGTVKRELAADAAMDIDRYLAGKSAILQEVLALSDLSESEKAAILRLNTGG
ncbi:GrpB family protein [Microbacterium sp. KR10-403]|uniref:GrpB family protein n=1 Tax=Microbacterium sp. KR10-403 TaxID=3158581 RepID=UPI0032E522BA